MLFQFAWRNIWRNRRRTLITVSSIAFAVFFACLLQAIGEGSWENMIYNVTNSYTGNIQIHKKGYWENPGINDLVPFDEAMEQLGTWESINHATPRLESFALASTGEFTKGAMILGIDPGRENNFTKMGDKVIEGAYLSQDDTGVLIGKDLSRMLRADIGDTIFLISQGYRGVNAVGLYPVKGKVRFPSPQLNRGMILMTLVEAQYLFGAQELISSLVIGTDPSARTDFVAEKIEGNWDTAAYEIMTFEELMPELIKSKEIDTSGNFIVYFILYTIIGFGIFGTLLMMLRERQYELGILLSIGMRRLEVYGMIWTELLLLCVIGALAGIGIGYAGAWYFHLNPIVLTGDFAAAMENFEFEPIIPASVSPRIFMVQGMIVFVLCMIISLYPLYHVMKIKPVEAMRT